MNQNILSANNGKQAFEKVKEYSTKSKCGYKDCLYFSQILMDFNMPIMSGAEATQEIISYWVNEFPSVKAYPPIVGLTAYSDSETKNQCQLSGMSAFYTKPVKKKKMTKQLYDIGQIESEDQN